MIPKKIIKELERHWEEFVKSREYRIIREQEYIREHEENLRCLRETEKGKTA